MELKIVNCNSFKMGRKWTIVKSKKTFACVFYWACVFVYLAQIIKSLLEVEI